MVRIWLHAWNTTVAKAPKGPPKSLAEAIRIVDQYALGDPMQPALDSVGACAMEAEYLGEERLERAESKCSGDFRGHVGWTLQIPYH